MGKSRRRPDIPSITEQLHGFFAPRLRVHFPGSEWWARAALSNSPSQQAPNSDCFCRWKASRFAGFA